MQGRMVPGLNGAPGLGVNLNANNANPASAVGAVNAPANNNPAVVAAAAAAVQNQKLYQLALDLINAEKREAALLELSKKREQFPDLAPILWHSAGTIAALLQEIVFIYPLLQNPSALTPAASNRCCNALALLYELTSIFRDFRPASRFLSHHIVSHTPLVFGLFFAFSQCVASHVDTRTLFLNAHIPLFLYPFLNTTHSHRPFEYLRLTSLGVVGALVKIDDSDVIRFLLQTEIIPLCLRIMETGSELSKTVATFIVQKILLDDMGLDYICQTAERFYTVSGVLSTMVQSLEKQASVRLLKHVVRCYLRLSDNTRAREALRQCMPESLRDNTFTNVLKDDPGTKRWLSQLLFNISAET